MLCVWRLNVDGFTSITIAIITSLIIDYAFNSSLPADVSHAYAMIHQNVNKPRTTTCSKQQYWKVDFFLIVLACHDPIFPFHAPCAPLFVSKDAIRISQNSKGNRGTRVGRGYRIIQLKLQRGYIGFNDLELV